MKKLLLAIIVCFLAGCSGKPVTPSKVDNVKRVFFMGNGAYAVLAEGENKELVRYYFGSYDGTTVRVFEDCPKDKKIWVNIDPSPGDNTKKVYTIHVHDSSEISGGNTGGKHPNPIGVVE